MRLPSYGTRSWAERKGGFSGRSTLPALSPLIAINNYVIMELHTITSTCGSTNPVTTCHRRQHAKPRRTAAAHFLVVAFALVVGISLAGCGWLGGPTITVEWKSPKDGLVPKTPLQFDNVIVGHVIEVESRPPGTVATVRLEKAQAHFVRTKSDFLFHPATLGHPGFVELIVLDKELPPAADGARFMGSDNSAETAMKWLATDWKRSGILLALAVVVVVVTLCVLRLLLKLWAVVVSVVVGAACAAYFGSLLAQQLTSFLPLGTRADLLGYAAGFVLGVIGTSLLLAVILKPFRSK